MSLASVITRAAVSRLETRLPKVVSPRVHAFTDYLHAAFFFGMALYCRKTNPRAATAALATGSFLLAESLITDCPLSAAKVIPFETHGKIDAAFAASSFLIPSAFGFSGNPEAVVFNLYGVAEVVIVGLTDFSSEKSASAASPLLERMAS